MKKNDFNSQSGKSLMEIMIVLAVAGVLVAMAVTRMTKAQANLERQNIAREFKVNLERARFDAVKRRADTTADETKITINSPTAYKVLLDIDQNGTLTPTSEERTISFAERSKVKIIGNAVDLVYPITITFDRFGNTKTVNGSNKVIAPVFTFCEGECTLDTANVTNSNIISLSATGTVAMLNGGDALPTFENPTVTTVADCTAVNNWVVTRDDDSTYPLDPDATPLPCVTTSPSPTPTPSPSPGDSPTTPVTYCTSGQKPSVANCVCKLPMTVRQNGKCQ